MPARHEDREVASFVPRITLTLATGFVLFLLAALLYVAPVLLEEAPPGAIQDWRRERVRARLEGRTLYLLVPSLAAAALLGARGWIPGTGARRP